MLVIFGASNRGKTSTISKIYDIFTNISKVDYYICATRTSGGSVKSINNIIAKDIVWFDDIDLTYDVKIPNPNIIDLYIDFQVKRVLNHIK